MKIHLVGGAAGNIRVALFDDNAGVPNNLKGESASLTAVADYTTNYAIAECQILATTAWMVHNQDNSGSKWGYWNTGSNRYYRSSFTFGAMPNPYGSGTADPNTAPRMKASHS